MIITIKNLDEYVIAYIESNRVNMNGEYDIHGRFIFVEDIWIHSDYRDRKTFLELIELVHQSPFYDRCTKVYWTILRNHSGKKILDPENHSGYNKIQRIYDRDKLMLKLRGESRCLENCFA